VAAALALTWVLGGGDGEAKPRIPMRSAAEALPPEPPETTVPSAPSTCIYRGPSFSPKKIGCAAGDFYWSSDECNSEITGNGDDFMLLREGNHDYAVAARARADRWNIRQNALGRPMLGYIIRASDSSWTLYNAKGRRIGHISGPDAAEAALVYLYFGDFECVM
jgi:hypothetical protein